MNTKEEVFAFLLEYMSQESSKTVINTWFQDTQIILLDESRCIISAPTDFKCNVLKERYTIPAGAALEALFGSPVRAEFIVHEDAHLYAVPERVSPHRNFDFDGFIVGESNKFAAAAAQAVAKNPGKIYNPLFIYGESGLGKTHLLYAIMNQIAAAYPRFKICDTTCENFTNELAQAIYNKTTPEFREKYRSVDMLLVDDIQFISGKDFVQEEFFHTFNALTEIGSQIVIISDKPPKDMKMLENRLQTRFDSGLLVDIQPPDFITRMAIVSAKSDMLDLIIPHEIIIQIAESITSNVRALEGSVKKLMVYRDMNSGEVSVEDAYRALNDLKRDNPGLNPTPQFILQKVCEHYRVDERAVLGNGRQDRLVNARHVAMYLIRTMTEMSLKNIGQDIFRRDHSTVKYAIDRVADDRLCDMDLNEHIEAILHNIKNNK